MFTQPMKLTNKTPACSSTKFYVLTWPDLRAFSSILMRLELRSSWSGVPLVLGGPAPTEAGLPMEAEDGDRELVGVRLRLGKLGGPGGA